jgi:hypothetical protein
MGVTQVGLESLPEVRLSRHLEGHLEGHGSDNPGNVV